MAEQIKLSLKIHPTAYNQRRKKHKLYQNRDIHLPIQPPALTIFPIHPTSLTS
jgi:hypothetical protein